MCDHHRTTYENQFLYSTMWTQGIKLILLSLPVGSYAHTLSCYYYGWPDFWKFVDNCSCCDFMYTITISTLKTVFIVYPHHILSITFFPVSLLWWSLSTGWEVDTYVSSIVEYTVIHSHHFDQSWTSALIITQYREASMIKANSSIILLTINVSIYKVVS